MATKHKIKTSSDMPEDNWVNLLVPAPLRPYCRLARLDRPIGTWLLLLPCWWGVALASAELTDDYWPKLYLIFLFGIGSVVMRGAGCTWNDIVDRDIDRRVARTASRPLASRVVSVRAAIIFLIFQLLLGLVILLQFNKLTIALAIGAIPLVVAYPFMKRVTNWPQAFLGLTFNWGALVGWTAVKGSLGWPAFLLYSAGFFWTLGYDTIYAHQDKEDDILIGVRSSAIDLGATTKHILWIFYGATLLFFYFAGWQMEMSWQYEIALVGVALGFIWQITFLNINDAKDCLEKFRSNRWIGLLVFAGLVFG